MSSKVCCEECGAELDERVPSSHLQHVFHKPTRTGHKVVCRMCFNKPERTSRKREPKSMKRRLAGWLYEQLTVREKLARLMTMIVVVPLLLYVVFLVLQALLRTFLR